MLCLSMFLMTFCSQSDNTGTLATFDGGDVSTTEYVEYFLSSTKYKADEVPTEENLKHIVSIKALEKMSVTEALAKGIDQDSLFKESVENNLRKSLFFKYMREEIINKTITDSLIKVYYDNFSPQYQVSYIVRPVKKNSTPEFAQSQKDSIQLAYKLLKEGAKFEDIVLKLSQDITTNQRGGHLGYVTGESLGDAALRAELKTLPQFTFSKPIRGFEAYYILYKGDMRNVEAPPFKEAQGKIWQSLYRSRRHDIQAVLDKRFAELEKKYHFKVNQNLIEKMLKKAGKTASYYTTTELFFERLTKEDMDLSIATYDDGEIKMYEFFEEKNREPGNELEFMDRYKLIRERHLLAKHAVELGYENSPEIKEKMEDVRISLLRSFLHRTEVVDKALVAKNIVKDDSSAFQEAAVRRQLKEELEQDMKQKYNFTFVIGNFKQALKIAGERKIAQNLEKETQKK